MSADSRTQYVHVDEVAKYLGVTTEEARKSAQRGRIPPYEVVNKVAVWRFADMQAFLADPRKWRQSNKAAVTTPSYRSSPLNTTRKCRPDQIKAALAALQSGPKTTVDIRNLLDGYAPDLIYQLRKQGHCITMKLVRATDANGDPHFNVAQYELVEAGS
ncbi:MAG: helix-turn-helix domain-containing protein [Burkholderiaceae bacterium]